MGRPKGSKNSNTKPAPVPGTPVVREQVKQLAGFADKEELKNALPDSTANPGATSEEPVRRTRKPRGEVMPPVDPLMNDPIYRDAIADMTAFGGARMVKSGFEVAAVITKDKSVKLNESESKRWDGFFYVVGKKTNLDPTNKWFLLAYGFGLLFEHVMVRVWQFHAESLTNTIAGLFGINLNEEEEEKKPENEEEKLRRQAAEQMASLGKLDA